MDRKILVGLLFLCCAAVVVVVVVLLLVLYPATRDMSAPAVATPWGCLRGSIIKSRLGRDIFAFRGVRYALSPVGPLRFKPPVPITTWQGTIDATQDGFACPQTNSDSVGNTSEDCLFLNVYSTQLPLHDGGNTKRSVLVWFHAGSWYAGTGNSLSHGPEYLLDQDIVLVTCNYRLGVLGFLSTGDAVLPGNYGMKDQVAVLRWVHQNIEVFGGDPGSVTVGGDSAGGASVWFHLVSPMSRGLFHRAISMSAAISAKWDIERDPKGQAQRQAELLGCPTGSSHLIADCLRNKSADEIVDSSLGMFEWGSNPILVYTPVLETSGEGERFIESEPEQLLRDGNFTKVPYLTGVTTDELSSKSLEVLGNASWREDMDQSWDKVAPIAFMYERDTNRSVEISRRLREFYLQNQPITSDSEEGLGELFADCIICFGNDRASKMISSRNPQSVFYYKFSYQGRFSFFYLEGTTTPYGVVHRDDLMYLFYISTNFPFFQPGDPEVQTVERLTSLWANFIKTGNPTPGNESVTWQPATNANHTYMDIGIDLEMKTDLYQQRMQLWDDLFPLH